MGVSPKWVKSKRQRKKEREKERTKVGNNNGQLHIATPPRVAHAKPPGPKDQANISIFVAVCSLPKSQLGFIIIKYTFISCNVISARGGFYIIITGFSSFD